MFHVAEKVKWNFKIIMHQMSNWKFRDFEKHNKLNLENKDKESIEELLIVSCEWQGPVVIYDWHANLGNHH